MNKYSLLIFIIFVSVIVPAQDKNKTITDDETGEPMLIGYTTREAFDDSNFSSWFNPEYDEYVPDSEILALLNGKLDSVDITIVMGSWCDDSHREVPGLFKILDNLGYPSEKVNIISVNRDKKSEEGDIEGLDVKFVPTIIFFRDGKELGRIVEMPNESLEKDMGKILNQ
ncbi:MAG: thioredoxin family protein [Ignavibacteriaceae bacterium]